MVEAPILSRLSSHEFGRVVTPMHRPPLPPRRYPGYSFLLEAALPFCTLHKLRGAVTCSSPNFGNNDTEFFFLNILFYKMQFTIIGSETAMLCCKLQIKPI